MKHARIDALTAFAQAHGDKVTVREGVKSQPQTQALTQAGLDPTLALDGTFSWNPGTDETAGTGSVSVVVPERAPEWLRVAIMAHEIGHGIGWRTGEYSTAKHFGTQQQRWDEEVRASERAVELLYGLGIRPSAMMYRLWNYSILSHGLGKGFTTEQCKALFFDIDEGAGR